MIKKIILISLIPLLSIIILTACNSDDSTDIENKEIKYELVEYNINNSEEYISYKEEYEYYHLVFNDINKTCYIEFKKINDSESTKTTGIYIETETSYVISINGTSLEFKKETMEMKLLMFNFRFKKVD